MDANDKKFFEQEFATIDGEEKAVNADECESHQRIQIAKGVIKGKRRMLEHWRTIKSDPLVALSNQINPPVGKCNTHVAWCVRTVEANPGKLNRNQILAFLSPQPKSNSKDRAKSVRDALTKSLRKPAQLRVDDAGFYWPNENPIRRMPTKDVHQPMFSADRTGSR